MDPGTTRHLRGVWGSGHDDVFAVGYGGTVVHYDGANWLTQASTISLYGVWGGPEDVFAVGESGTVIHHDGANRQFMTTHTSSPLRGVWASGPDNVFAVGDDGSVVHYDDSGGALMDSQTTSDLNAVWGSNPDNVFAVGDSRSSSPSRSPIATELPPCGP